MAAPMERAASSNSSDGDDQKAKQAQTLEELDFCSSKFDPLKALFSADVKVPFENVKTFPTVASYEAAIDKKKKGKTSQSQSSLDDSEQRGVNKSNTLSKSKICDAKRAGGRGVQIKQTIPKRILQVPEASSSSRTASATTSRLESRLKAIAQNSKLSVEKLQEQDNRRRNVLTRMVEAPGPLELLWRCVKEHLHVRVMTRAAVTVRSICRGYIVAFDKSFNMALIDVDEIYRRPACLGKVRARRTHKLQSAQKTLKVEREEQREKFLSGKMISSLSLAETTASSQKPEIVDSSINPEIKNQELGHGKDRLITLDKNKDVIKGDSSVFKEPRGSSEINLRDGKSVHQGVQLPYSFYEREALMLGIPDENLEHRHVNQLFIRGDNVVVVSIINE